MEQKDKSKVYKPVVLMVLDGFGVNIDSPQSTWKYAKMPTLRMLEQKYPFTTLQASGIAVGLPWGQEGNSEVGHLTIGAGRALYHHLPRIITAIEDGTFFQNPAFVEAGEHAKKNSGVLHLLGLFSSGSVHAYADHLYALLEFAAQQSVSKVYIHVITDGKDAPGKEARELVGQLQEQISTKYPFAKIASILGRFYAMDRDEHWDRIEQSYQCLIQGTEAHFENPLAYIDQSYEKGLLDGALEPIALSDNEGRIKAGDALIFYNFREDSERELVSAFVLDNFTSFARSKIENLFVVTMTEYDKRFLAHVAFPPLDIVWPLGRAISEAGKKQLHVAETEKYAHVTYFFNGGREDAFPGEDRTLIHSPQTAHFDEVPEMSASEIRDAVINTIEHYDFILANFANADMVGHTGNFDATVKALETIDTMLAAVVDAVLKHDGALLITADHGNAEEKLYATSGEKRTKHTANPVPFFLVAKEFESKENRMSQEIEHRYHATTGVITDVAPTVLKLMGIAKPVEMTGINLLPKLGG